MRTKFAALTALVAGLAAVFITNSPRAADTVPKPPYKLPKIGSDQDAIVTNLQWHRKEMVRVTVTPFLVSFHAEHPELAALCVDPGQWEYGPHNQHWIHVFVSPSGTNAMSTGTGKYPVGAMILKQKFRDETGTNTVFYTGMLKREPGYNPEMGDWQFFTVDSSGSQVTASGHIDSCMECHAAYSSTDFVTRKYLRNTKPEGK